MQNRKDQRKCHSKTCACPRGGIFISIIWHTTQNPRNSQLKQANDFTNAGFLLYGQMVFMLS